LLFPGDRGVDEDVETEGVEAEGGFGAEEDEPGVSLSDSAPLFMITVAKGR
jgi:hypothetical protein